MESVNGGDISKISYSYYVYVFVFLGLLFPFVVATPRERGASLSFKSGWFDCRRWWRVEKEYFYKEKEIF